MRRPRTGPACVILLVAAAAAGAAPTAAADAAGYAGYPAPGPTPQVFAPGLVSTDAYEFAVTFTPDMGEIYFTRRRDPGPNGICRAVVADGALQAPQPVALSGKDGDYEPCVAPDGSGIYFGNDISLWVCPRGDAGWLPARELPPQINGGFAMAACVDAEGSVYFTRNRGLHVARRDGGGYRPAEPVAPCFVPPAGDAAHGFMAPDGSCLVFDAQGRDGVRGRGDLFVSFRNADASWSEPRSLAGLNSDGTEMCPSITPDGRFLFFCRDGDIYWVDASVLAAYR